MRLLPASFAALAVLAAPLPAAQAAAATANAGDWERAVAAVRAGRFEEAVVAARLATEAHPEHAGSHFLLGSSLLRLDRSGEAIVSLERAYRIAPEESSHALLLAQALLKAGRAAAAVEPLTALVSGLAGDSPVTAGERTALARLVARTAMDVRAAETAALLERSLERMPEESILWLARGETLRSAGRPIEAYEALLRGQRTGAASRQAGEAALRLAQSRAGEESDPATRIVWWRRAAEAADLLLQLDVDVPTLRVSADAWLAAGEPSTAAARLRSAMELASENSDLLYQLARCDLAADDVAAAEKHLEAALATAPSAELEPRIQRALATVYHRRGAYDAAAAAYRRAGMVDEAAAVAELAETGRECRALRDRLQGMLRSSEAPAGSSERRAIEAELEATLATCAHVLDPPAG